MLDICLSLVYAFSYKGVSTITIQDLKDALVQAGLQPDEAEKMIEETGELDIE